MSGETIRDDEELAAWLREFKERHGRPLRVLHVGNVANNAYQNARITRGAGIEAHVLCPSYYHVMATPEWEEIELKHDHGDDNFPKFASEDLKGYQRPFWFINGPLFFCATQIEQLWGQKISWWQRIGLAVFAKLTRDLTKLVNEHAGYTVELLLTNPELLLFKALTFIQRRLSVRASQVDLVGRFFVNAVRRQRIAEIIKQFDEVFPDRPDRLISADVLPYVMKNGAYARVFRHYDIVQSYATDPIEVLLSGKHPYVAFEHGTLRSFTMRDDPRHRLTALAYHQSDHTFITNGDCLAYAQKLAIPYYSPIIHAVDVEQHRRDFGGAIDAVRRELDGDVILFCPTRHDWDIKGTDRFVRALPLIKQRLPGKRVRLVLVDWGFQVEGSKQLLAESGCVGDVIWRKTMCRITTIKYMRAADVVFDQMVLPVFGSTAPQSIAAGTPVVGSYVAEETRWLIPEPAPIMSAFSPEEIANAVVTALDPQWLADYKERARRWTDAYHSPDVVVREHLRAYRRVLRVAEAT